MTDSDLVCEAIRPGKGERVGQVVVGTRNAAATMAKMDAIRIQIGIRVAVS